jgi:hypothetical protein
VVVIQNAECVVNHVGPFFDGVGLDLARHDALDKVRAHCLKIRLNIAGVVPAYLEVKNSKRRRRRMIIRTRDKSAYY